MASEDIDFDFTTWSSGLGLSEKTIKQLKRENCDKLSSLKTLQLKDVMELNLTIGDRNLILKAVEDMNKRLVHATQLSFVKLDHHRLRQF